MKLNLESPLFDYINTGINFILLNFIFIVSCLPVFTIGSAMTGMYQVTLREVKKEYGYMIRTYIRCFVKSFWLALQAELMLVIPFLIISFSALFWKETGGIAAEAASVLLGLAGLVLMMSGAYLFPLLARYETNASAAVRNSICLALGYPFYTALLLLVSAVLVAILYFTDAGKIFMCIVGFSFAAMCKSVILVKVFDRYELDGDEKDN